MKNLHRIALAALGSLLVLASAQAEPKPRQHLRVLAAAGEPETKFEKRIIHLRGDEPGEMKKVAFLGVETTAAPAELTAQLNLAADTGLVVRHIVPASPAAAALQPHDLLLKLDDQLLIEPRQFAVLIRNHKAGDEVTLTYLRGGKESTAKVKLTEHEVPKRAIFGAAGAGDNLQYFVQSGGQAMPGADLNRTLSLLDRARADAQAGPRHIAITGPGFQSTTVNTSNSSMLFNDDQGALELTIKDGRKTLVAKNAKGEPLFSGPIDTPEQRKALPAEVRTRLDKIEGLQEFSFQVEVEGKDDLPKAAPRGIALPLPPDAEAERLPERKPAVL